MVEFSCKMKLKQILYVVIIEVLLDDNMLEFSTQGDGNIRYYEIVDDAPYVHYLNQYQSGLPQRGLGKKKQFYSTNVLMIHYYEGY